MTTLMPSLSFQSFFFYVDNNTKRKEEAEREIQLRFIDCLVCFKRSSKLLTLTVIPHNNTMRWVHYQFLQMKKLEPKELKKPAQSNTELGSEPWQPSPT